MDKKKIVIIVIAVVVIAAIIGCAYWKNKNKPVSTQPTAATEEAASATEAATEAAGAITESATQGVLPSIGNVTNPLENKPVVNPVDVSNPFKSIRTNPFQ